MRHSDRIDLVGRLLPFPSWKAALLRRHVEKCPACGGRLASLDETCRIVTESGGVGGPPGLWPAVRAKIMADAEKAGPRPKRTPAGAWRWAVALTGFGFAVFATVAAVAYFRTGRVSSGADVVVAAKAASEPADLSLFYVRIGNETARTFVLKPRGSNMVIIWAEKNQ
jgi:hypothetical protein